MGVRVEPEREKMAGEDIPWTGVPGKDSSMLAAFSRSCDNMRSTLMDRFISSLPFNFSLVSDCVFGVSGFGVRVLPVKIGVPVLKEEPVL